MHSSRMHTGHSLTVCRSLLPGGGVSAPGGSAPEGVVWSGGSSLLGGVCSGGCLLQGVSASGGGGGCLLGGLLLGGVWSGGVLPGGCLLPGGVVSQHALRQTPSREQNDKQVQKYYLGHNFVATGNKKAFKYIVYRSLDQRTCFCSQPSDVSTRGGP